MSDDKPFAFVLMPFDTAFEDIYKLGIQQTADDLGIVAQRVDEQLYNETILEQIYRQIKACDFIIADMSGRNPNVFYEVGYAHALQKMCTLLTETADDIPFDLKHHRHIVYGGSISTLKKKLAVELEWLKKEVNRLSTEFFDIKLTTGKAMLIKEDWRIDGTLDITLDIHNRANKKSPEIETMYIYTGRQWNFLQKGTECAYTDDTGDKRIRRHFVKPDVLRLSQGGWTQIKLHGQRNFWMKYSAKEEPKDTYRASGAILVEINTSDGVYKKKLYIDEEFDEFPF